MTLLTSSWPNEMVLTKIAAIVPDAFFDRMAEKYGITAIFTDDIDYKIVIEREDVKALCEDFELMPDNKQSQEIRRELAPLANIGYDYYENATLWQYSSKHLAELRELGRI